MSLQNLNKDYCKMPKPLCISQCMKQQKTANCDKSISTSRGSYLMYTDEHNKVFINKIEKAGSIYTKI